MKKIGLFIILFLFLPVNLLQAESLPGRLSGYILLQVEEHGEAWYVNPEDKIRYFLARPADAFTLMRKQGAGISNKDLSGIPVGVLDLTGIDSDKDGLVDALEESLGTDQNSADTDKDGHTDYTELKAGYNPLGSGALPVDNNLSARLSGRILLQVESHGEAWYVYPKDNHRYFLSRPADALVVMRSLGLGISNVDLAKIGASAPDYKVSDIEKRVFDLINEERIKRNLLKLSWRDDLAEVARRHSEDLAAENVALTGFGIVCDYPIIHHEGTEFGLYHNNRLHNMGVYDFDKSAENIALMGAARARISSSSDIDIEREYESCKKEREPEENEFKERLESALADDKLEIIDREMQKREEKVAKEKIFQVVKVNWSDTDKVARETVDGWINSTGHFKNLTNPDYNQSGMGAAFVNGYVILTQVFIHHAECGYLTGACCEEKGYYPYCFRPLTCNDGICGE